MLVLKKIGNQYSLRDRLPLTDRLPITGQFGLYTNHLIDDGGLSKSLFMGLGKKLVHHFNMEEI